MNDSPAVHEKGYKKKEILESDERVAMNLVPLLEDHTVRMVMWP